VQAANTHLRFDASFAEASPQRVSALRLLVSMLVLAAALASAQSNQTDAKLSPPALASPATASRASLICHLRNTFGQPLTGISVEIRDLKTHSIITSVPTGPDGAVEFRDLSPGRYEITVAGGILPPRREVQMDGHDSQFTLQLPLSPPNGRSSPTVSVQQLTMPRQAIDALNAATEAWKKYDWKRARTQATRALELQPGYGAALSILGFLDLQDGKLELACADLKHAIESDPGSGLAYLTLGATYNSMKRYEEAVEALSVFPSVAVDTWQVHYELARSFIGLRKYELGLQEIGQAQRLTHDDRPLLRLGKAHALLGLHRSSEATAELETILLKQPDSPFASDARTLLSAVRSQKRQKH